MTNRVSAPGGGWRPAGHFKKAGLNSDVVENLNSMADAAGRANVMDFGKEGVHTSQGFFSTSQNVPSGNIKIVRLLTKLEPGSQSSPKKATGFVMETSDTVSGRLTQSTEKVEIINYLGLIYGPAGSLVICHELNGLNVVVEGYGRLPLYGKLLCNLPAASPGDGVYFDESIPTTSTLEIWVPDPDHDPISNPRSQYVFSVVRFEGYSRIVIGGDRSKLLCKGSQIVLRNGPNKRNGTYTLSGHPVVSGGYTKIDVIEYLDTSLPLSYDELIIVRPKEMKSTTTLQVVVNRNTKAGAFTGDFVRAIWRNFEYQVELGGGGGGVTEIVDFRILHFCYGFDGAGFNCSCYEAEVIRVTCVSSVRVGDIINIYDPDRCWLNMPASLLFGRKGTAILCDVGNNRGGHTDVCTLSGNILVSGCFWKVQSLCCAEEQYATN